jgi:hypothetical protein
MLGFCVFSLICWSKPMERKRGGEEKKREREREKRGREEDREKGKNNDCEKDTKRKISSIFDLLNNPK